MANLSPLLDDVSRPAAGPTIIANRPVTPGQIARWRTELAWNDGEGLDGESCERLLDEVERLRQALRAARLTATRLAQQKGNGSTPSMKG